MRLCDPHFAELRAALEGAGIGWYCSKSHLQALERYEREGHIESGPITLERFDGVLVSYHTMLELAEDAVGTDCSRMLVISLNAICPVCSFGKEAHNWIPTGAKVARNVYDRLIGGTA